MSGVAYSGKRNCVISAGELPGMAERTVTVGRASKELRMIGWRVGWTVAPEALLPDLVAVSLANVVVPVGIAQDAAATALEQYTRPCLHTSPNCSADATSSCATWATFR